MVLIYFKTNLTSHALLAFKGALLAEKIFKTSNHETDSKN